MAASSTAWQQSRGTRGLAPRTAQGWARGCSTIRWRTEYGVGERQEEQQDREVVGSVQGGGGRGGSGPSPPCGPAAPAALCSVDRGALPGPLPHPPERCRGLLCCGSPRLLLLPLLLPLPLGPPLRPPARLRRQQVTHDEDAPEELLEHLRGIRGVARAKVSLLRGVAGAKGCSARSSGQAPGQRTGRRSARRAVGATRSVCAPG